VPSPGGQVSGMDWGVASRRPPRGATTRQPGGQSCMTSAGGCVEGWPPGLPRGWAMPGRRDATRAPAWFGGANPERTVYEPRHAPARDSMNAQVRQHAKAQDVSRRATISAFGTKRSGVAASSSALPAGPPLESEAAALQIDPGSPSSPSHAPPTTPTAHPSRPTTWC